MSEEIESKEDLIEAVESLQGKTPEIDDLKEQVDNISENAVTEVPELPDDVLTPDDLDHLAHDNCETEWCNNLRDALGISPSEEEAEEQEGEQGPEHPEEDDGNEPEEEEGEGEADAESDGEEAGGGSDEGGSGGSETDDSGGPIFG